MKKVNLLLLVSAMGFSALASVLAWNQLQQMKVKTSGSVKTESVYVVAQNVSAHQLVTVADVVEKQVAVSSVESGVITNLSNIVNHYSASKWFKGQQVISAMVVSSDSGSAFPISIPDGDRAFSVNDDAVTGVDHLISPGDRVDVVAALPLKNGKSVKTILQNILVLHVDNKPQKPSGVSTVNSQNAQQTMGNADTITLALTPMQIEQIEYAEVMGQVRLSLRNPSETTTNSLPAVNQSNAG